MTNKRILDLIEQYMKANAAHRWDEAQKIFEEYKAEERRQEERDKEKQDA